jgi:hypothetical protein
MKDAAPMKAELLTRYDRYIVDEVLPLIRKDCGDGEKSTLNYRRESGSIFFR